MYIQPLSKQGLAHTLCPLCALHIISGKLNKNIKILRVLVNTQTHLDFYIKKKKKIFIFSTKPNSFAPKTSYKSRIKDNQALFTKIIKTQQL